MPPPLVVVLALEGCVLIKDAKRTEIFSTVARLWTLPDPFLAESEEQLLDQIRDVSIEDYRKQRNRQAQAESPRKFLYRLHREPEITMRKLAEKYMSHFPVQWPVIVLVPNNALLHTV